MTQDDKIEPLLRAYFAAEVKAEKDRGLGTSVPSACRNSPPKDRPPDGLRRRVAPRLLAAVLAAATVAVALATPILQPARSTAAARHMAEAHRLLDTGRILETALANANRSITSFSGGMKND